MPRATGKNETPILIATKKQLEEARNADDDWTGKASARERRKLQNKLHQRAWRRRKAQQASLPTYHPLPPSINDPSLNTAFAIASASLLPRQVSSARLIHNPPTRTPVEARTPSTPNCLAIMHHNLHTAFQPWPHPSDNKLIPPLLPYCTSTTPTINRDFILQFPLSPDHYLITLIQYNVLRAIMTNYQLVSLSLPTECKVAMQIPLLHNPPSKAPPTFEPTPTQRSVEHDAWIDSVPCPRLRDNLINASVILHGGPDEELGDILCDDVCGGLYEGFNDCETRGLLVWGDPWLVSSWEVSAGFATKWGWLLKGCGEMLEATNTWRARRGEDPLVLEVEE